MFYLHFYLYKGCFMRSKVVFTCRTGSVDRGTGGGNFVDTGGWNSHEPSHRQRRWCANLTRKYILRSISLSLYLSISHSLSFYLSIYLSLSIYICIYFLTFTYISSYLSIGPTIFFNICIPIYLSKSVNISSYLITMYIFISFSCNVAIQF